MNLNKILRIALPILLVLYIGAIFYVATMTLGSQASKLADYDKLIHAAEFFILSILVIITLAVYRIREAPLVAMFLTLVLILASELVQLPLFGRSFSYLDLVADLSGAALGFGITYGINAKWNFLKRLS